MSESFNELQKQLNHYLQSGPKAREIILEKTNKRLAELPATITNDSKSAKAYHTMVYAAAMINVANDLIAGNEPQLSPLYPKNNYHVFLTKEGACRFLKDSDGDYSLPFADLDDKDKNNWLKSLLDEYLEKKHSELYKTATGAYNAVDTKAFQEVLRACIYANTQFNDHTGPGLNILKKALLDTLELNKANAAVLTDIINTTYTYEPNGEEHDKAAQRQFLDKLRQQLQINTFKLTNVYTSASNLIPILKKETQHYTRTIEEHSQFVYKTFNEFFNTNKIEPTPLNSKLASDSSEYLTLAQALVKFESIPVTHLLCLFKANPIYRDTQTQYNDVRRTLTDAINLTEEDLRAKAAKDKETFRTEMQAITRNKQSFESKGETFKPLVSDLDKLLAKLTSLAKSDNEKIEELTQVARDTNELFKTGKVGDYYDAVIAIKQGKASPGMTALGAIMLILAATAAILCWVAATPVMAIATACATAALVTSSITFFALSPQKGLSKITNNIGDFVAQNPSEAPTPSC